LCAKFGHQRALAMHSWGLTIWLQMKKNQGTICKFRPPAAWVKFDVEACSVTNNPVYQLTNPTGSKMFKN